MDVCLIRVCEGGRGEGVRRCLVRAPEGTLKELALERLGRVAGKAWFISACT